MKKKIFKIDEFEELGYGSVINKHILTGMHLKGSFVRITPWAEYTFLYDDVKVEEGDVHIDITEKGLTNKQRIVRLFIHKNKIEALATSCKIKEPRDYNLPPRELSEQEKIFKEQYELKWVSPEVDPPMKIFNTSGGRKQFKPISFDTIEVIVPVKVKIRTPTHESRFSGTVRIYSEEEKLESAKTWARSVLRHSILPGAVPCVGPKNCNKSKDEFFMTGPTVRIDGTAFESFQILEDRIK